MEVICLEEEAFYSLINRVVEQLKSDQNNTNDPPWVGDERAMEILGCRTSKLQELRDTEVIEFSQPSRKWIMYKTESLYNYLEQHKK